MTERPFTFYEFFAGGGMARLGLGAGWTCAFANDFDPMKAAAYRANFGGDHLKEGDVWTLSANDLPGVADLAWASSPCQDFSLAGARAGLSGGRSSAFFGFWRLMEALAREARAPRLIVVENVVGLLTSHGGRDFAALCEALAGAGYRFGAVEADASAFTPQSRRRVLIIATRLDPPALPAGVDSPAVAKARAALPPAVARCWIAWPNLMAPARNADLAAILEPDEAVAWRCRAETQQLLALMDDVHRAKLAQALRTGERRVGALFRRVRSGGQRAEVRFDGLAGCLRTPRGGSSRQFLVITEHGEVQTRLISPREAARLMGLPDHYRLPSSANAALHLAGDGVVVPMVRALAEQILEPALRPAGRKAVAA